MIKKKPLILLILDIFVILCLIGTSIYIHNEKQIVKDIATGRTNPCYQCMHTTNWNCFDSWGLPIKDNIQRNNLSEFLSISNKSKN